MSRYLRLATELNLLYEGFRAEPYLCSANVWTVGIGSTRWAGRVVTQDYPNSVTLSDAMAESEREISSIGLDLAYYFRSRTPHEWSEFTDNQRAAMIVFSYNTGWMPGTRNFDTLNRCVTTGDITAWPKVIGLYNKAAGVVSLGLGRRRRAEGLLWYGKTPQQAYDQALRENP